MRDGWTVGQGAAVLGLKTGNGFSKKINPAMQAIAMLTIVNPVATAADMAAILQSIPHDEIVFARRRLTEYESQRIDGACRVQRLNANAAVE